MGMMDFGTSELKLCSRCKNLKSISEFHTRHKNRFRGGVPYVYIWIPTECAACEHERKAEYRATPQGRENERKAHERYYSKPEKQELLKQYRQSDRWKEVVQKYEDSEKGLARTERFLSTDKGQVYLKQKRRRHRDKRETLIKTNTVKRKLTERQWRILVRAYEGACAYCGRKGMTLTRDHVVPITKGGLDTRDNVVPSCAPCNEKKSDAIDWTPNPPTRPLKF